MTLYRPKSKDPKTGKTRRDKNYVYERKVAGRRRRVNLKVSDKRAAELLANKLRRQEELERAGLNTHSQTREQPLQQLVSEYVEELKRRGKSAQHISQTSRRLMAMTEDARDVADVTPTYVANQLHAIGEARALTGKTINYYRGALSAFFNWLVRMHRWNTNPVGPVARVEESTPQRERRALTEAEVDRLLRTAPFARSVLYRVLLTTGLRRGEAMRLERSAVSLEKRELTIRREVAKGRREDVLPLTHGAAEALGAYWQSSPEVTRALPPMPTYETFYRDLERAQIKRENDQGVINLHALRVTFVTDLCRNNVPLAEAQKLARHSTPVLTANCYTKMELVDHHAAVAKIDPKAPCGQLPEEVKTAGAKSGARNVIQTDTKRLTSMLAEGKTPAEAARQAVDNPSSCKTLQNRRGGTRTRTGDTSQRILSPSRLPFRHSPFF